jgi:hypothetical protein
MRGNEEKCAAMKIVVLLRTKNHRQAFLCGRIELSVKTIFFDRLYFREIGVYKRLKHLFIKFQVNLTK